MIIAFPVSTIYLISRRDNGSLRNNAPKIKKKGGGAGKNYNNNVIIICKFSNNTV